MCSVGSGLWSGSTRQEADLVSGYSFNSEWRSKLGHKSIVLVFRCPERCVNCCTAINTSNTYKTRIVMQKLQEMMSARK